MNPLSLYAAMFSISFMLIGCNDSEALLASEKVNFHTEKTVVKTSSRTSNLNYDSILESLTAEREKLHIRFIATNSNEEQNQLIVEGRELLFKTLTEKIFPGWYGTPWTWNGHTDKPGEGSIACGFFVTTVLKHAGFQLDRIRMGRQPSEYIILNLTDETNIRRFSDRPVSEVIEEITLWGPVTGLTSVLRQHYILNIINIINISL